MSVEIRALLASEMEAHTALVHASYYEYVKSGERTFLADPQWWLKSARADPYYQPEQTRVMVIDGQLVASVTNYDREMHIDGRLARVSCIGSVCTHPNYRRQGHVREVLAESIGWMQREGFHWSFLFGKEAVYGGSGWTMLTTFHLAADLRVVEQYGKRAIIRAVDPATDPATLHGIYREFNSRLTGPVARNEAYWRDRVLAGRFSRPGPTYYIVEVGGRPVGYFCGENGQVSEIGWLDEPREVLAAVLRRWPGQTVQFNCYSTEMVHLLRSISYVPGYAAYCEHRGGLTLTEAYKGLWRYIGDAQGRFPEISDTDSLKRFLRDHEYVFWPADGF